MSVDSRGGLGRGRFRECPPQDPSKMNLVNSEYQIRNFYYRIVRLMSGFGAVEAFDSRHATPGSSIKFFPNVWDLNHYAELLSERVVFEGRVFERFELVVPFNCPSEAVTHFRSRIVFLLGELSREEGLKVVRDACAMRCVLMAPEQDILNEISAKYTDFAERAFYHDMVTVPS